MFDKHVKKCPTLLVIGEVKIKTTVTNSKPLTNG